MLLLYVDDLRTWIAWKPTIRDQIWDSSLTFSCRWETHSNLLERHHDHVETHIQYIQYK